MGCNYFSDKSILKIRETLNSMGYVKDYPKDIFGVGLMVTFGMSKKRAIEWINNFEVAGKIKIDHGVVNFI